MLDQIYFSTPTEQALKDDLAAVGFGKWVEGDEPRFETDLALLTWHPRTSESTNEDDEAVYDLSDELIGFIAWDNTDLSTSDIAKNLLGAEMEHGTRFHPNEKALGAHKSEPRYRIYGAGVETTVK